MDNRRNRIRLAVAAALLFASVGAYGATASAGGNKVCEGPNLLNSSWGTSKCNAWNRQGQTWRNGNGYKLVVTVCNASGSTCNVDQASGPFCEGVSRTPPNCYTWNCVSGSTSRTSGHTIDEAPNVNWLGESQGKFTVACYDTPS